MFPFQLVFLGGLFALSVLFIAVSYTAAAISEARAARKQQGIAPVAQGAVKRAA